MRTLVLILACALSSGCFVFDEIDAGQREMDRYGGKGRPESAEVAKSEQPSPKERARQWWDKARTLTPREDDAKSDIVSCDVNGAIRFTTQTDCQHIGGRVAGG
jgi:hypothetical protein